jgi:hypothetical protein
MTARKIIFAILGVFFARSLPAIYYSGQAYNDAYAAYNDQLAAWQGQEQIRLERLNAARAMLERLPAAESSSGFRVVRDWRSYVPRGEIRYNEKDDEFGFNASVNGYFCEVCVKPILGDANTQRIVRDILTKALSGGNVCLLVGGDSGDKISAKLLFGDVPVDSRTSLLSGPGSFLWALELMQEKYAGTSQNGYCSERPGKVIEELRKIERFARQSGIAKQRADAEAEIERYSQITPGEPVAPQECPTGYVNDVGAAEVSGCIANVPAGQYIKTPGGAPVVLDIPGAFISAHDVPYGGVSSPQSCDIRFPNIDEGKASISDCYAQCSDYQYWTGSACAVCTPGYTCAEQIIKVVYGTTEIQNRLPMTYKVQLSYRNDKGINITTEPKSCTYGQGCEISVPNDMDKNSEIQYSLI